MKKKIYLSSLIFVIIDFISKIIIMSFYKNPITVIDKFFYIEKATNTGAAFSILTGGRILFIIIAILVLFYICKYMIKDVNNKTELISISMLIGGIIGNLIDRVVYGKVIDFLSLRFGSYNFPVFNLADIFITVGIFILLISSIRGGKDGNKSN